tara:strand:+ start:843 stop:947 length:105 start_codon:yes stop_codon:yes gene_type:complete
MEFGQDAFTTFACEKGLPDIIIHRAAKDADLLAK